MVNAPLGPDSQPFIFLVTYLWARQAGVLDYTRPEKLAGTKTLADKSHLQVTKKMPCGEYTPEAIFAALHFLSNLLDGPTS